MTDAAPPFLSAVELARLAEGQARAPCPRCTAIRAPGWEALPSTLDRGALRRVATLRAPGEEDPTLAEHHPAGTNNWSADAPIAPSFFPYNRCDVWQCVQCGRPFLRYTEYGGYYVEERVRELRPELVVTS
jgi:hypothetical protein